VELHNADCRSVMLGMADNSVDLIATDPPYFKVKNEPWDRQWDNPACFLKWLDGILAEFHRILRPNGSLYLFASPQMSARVECLIGERFNVLNDIRWIKTAGWHNKTKKEDLRQFLNPWESIIFAEHYGADNIAKGEAGYAAKCDELRGFLFEPLRAYFCDEFERAGMLNQEGKIAANVACGFSPSAGGMASRHYFSQSQWQLPTAEHYAKLRGLLNGNGDEYLRREYEELRLEYEELRLEYEELRRPFSVSSDVPFTDVWTFPTVSPHNGKHPCAKPVEMMAHIIESSSREGATVFDPFMGGGSTGQAAQMLGRKFIGCEMNPDYFRQTQARLSQRDLLAA